MKLCRRNDSQVLFCRLTPPPHHPQQYTLRSQSLYTCQPSHVPIFTCHISSTGSSEVRLKPYEALGFQTQHHSDLWWLVGACVSHLGPELCNRRVLDACEVTVVTSQREGRFLGTIPFRYSCYIHKLTVISIPDMLIGVHCTHGLNRTGYLICRCVYELHSVV